TVREVSAVLPGEAQLTLYGRLPGRGRGTLFEGAGRLVAPDLRGTLRWLEPFAPAVLGALPLNALRAGDLTAKVAIDPAQASLSDLRGTLDGAALQGGLALRLAPRIGVSAGLSVERFTLDPWLPDPAGLMDPAAAHAALTHAVQRAGFDADVKLQVAKAAWRGAELTPFSIDIQSEAGRLTLRRLEASGFGMRVTASGTLGEGGRISEGRVEASAQDAAALRPLLPWDLPDLLRGSASLLLQLSGPPDALASRVTLDLDDLRVEAQPVLNLATRRLSGSLTVHHPGAPRLLALLGVPGTASWLGDGSFSLIAQTTAAPGRIDLENFELVAGSLRASGKLEAAGRAVSGRVSAETLTLPMISPGSPDPLPVAKLKDVQANIRLEAGDVLVGLTPVLKTLSSDLTLASGSLQLGNLTAKLGGGEVRGTARLELADVPRLAVSGQAKGVTIAGPLWDAALDLTGGQADVQVDVVGEGHSPAAVTATLTGSGKVQVRDGVATGFDLAAAASALTKPDPAGMTASVRAALSGGTTPFSLLEAELQARRGVLTIDAKATAAAGAATLTGTLDLLGGTLEARLALRPGNELPELATRLTGPATQPVRTPELAGLARWLAERP
ncbi:MAG TPA: AsmA-like C-terminal region-containing protein, partial [Acetobacteraceae bacterium]|nr:AsmA-like C-terminal region-containing protein [Acetobacteraceae bacterium]